jgi:16S rRNA (guanine1207-N2)-methyltransferase
VVFTIEARPRNASASKKKGQVSNLLVPILIGTAMSPPTHAVYGHIPRDLVEVPANAVQCSPLIPGAAVLAEFPQASLSAMVLHAPASVIERRRVIALALRALGSGGALTVLAANDRGGTRLANELEAFGCTIEVGHKRHHRIITSTRRPGLVGQDEAIAAGEPRFLTELGLWSQPGLFSWDRIDPGSQLLIDHLPLLHGRGADLGCGIGVLARAVHQRSECQLTLIDTDQRALDMARRNVTGANVVTLWADIRTATNLPTALDFIVTNPPFHDTGEEDRGLGHAFIQKAAGMLAPGGTLWLTANRHLPYEATLTPLFPIVDQVAQAKGYKIYAAKKASAVARSARARDRA